MISIENIEALLKESKCNHIRIYDRTMTNQLLDIDAENSDLAFEKFRVNSEVFAGYGVLTIKAGDDAIHRRSMAGAKVWKVFFPGNNGTSTTPGIQSINQTPINTGYSKEYIETVIALRGLQMQMDYDKKERELEKKYASGDGDIEKYFKYAPLVAGFLGMSDEQIMAKLQMCQIAGSGMSGTQTKTKLTVQGTDEEKEKIVEQLVPSIFNKVDKDKFIAVLNAVNQNPEFLESAYMYMSMTSNQNNGMAGVNLSDSSNSNDSIDDYVQIGFINPNNNEFF